VNAPIAGFAVFGEDVVLLTFRPLSPLQSAAPPADADCMREIQLRRVGVCGRCDRVMGAGEPAEWDADAGLTTCLGCRSTGTAVGGPVGLVLHRDRAPHTPRFGLAPPSQLRSWPTDPAGEEKVGQVLDRTLHIEVLHDRRLPGDHSTIDHVVVARSGIWVVSAHVYRNQRVEVRDDGTWFRRSERLFVGGVNRHVLAESVLRQVGALREAVRPAASGVPVRAALCFVAGDWAWLSGPLGVDGVAICWPRALARVLTRRGTLESPARARLADVLRSVLPPADSPVRPAAIRQDGGWTPITAVPPTTRSRPSRLAR
jgi:hypothetical protein